VGCKVAVATEEFEVCFEFAAEAFVGEVVEVEIVGSPALLAPCAALADDRCA
jgi:hypothetical protein